MQPLYYNAEPPTPSYSLGTSISGIGKSCWHGLPTAHSSFPQPGTTQRTQCHEGFRDHSERCQFLHRVQTKRSTLIPTTEQKARRTPQEGCPDSKLISQNIRVGISKHQQALCRIYTFMWEHRRGYFQTGPRMTSGEFFSHFCNQNTQVLARSCQVFILTLPKLLN